MTLVAFVVVTHQPGAVGGNEDNAYQTDTLAHGRELGELLADGASPPMSFMVLPVQPTPQDA